jgi:hypothetical protein
MAIKYTNSFPPKIVLIGIFGSKNKKKYIYKYTAWQPWSALGNLIRSECTYFETIMQKTTLKTFSEHSSPLSEFSGVLWFEQIFRGIS